MNIKKYFTNLKASVSSIDYYLKIIDQPLKNSFFFFIITMIIVGSIRGAYSAIIELPKIRDQAYIAMDELNDNFDQDLEIIWADNQLELNRDFLDVNWPSVIDVKKYQLPDTLAVISNSETSPQESELLTDKTTLLFINQNNIYSPYEDDGQKWNEYSLESFLGEFESFSINKQMIPKIIINTKETIDRLFVRIQIFQVFITLSGFIFSRIWFLIGESILVYFLFKIYGINFNFKKVLKLSMNILVPTEIIHLYSDRFFGNLSFPIDSIAFWVILSFISFHLSRSKTKKIAE